MKVRKTWRRLIVAFAATSVAVLGGNALAQEKPAGCIQAGAPTKVEGQVVQISPDQGRVTMRDSNGATHDFRASAETLRSYKVGDRIQATLRPGQECQKAGS